MSQIRSKQLSINAIGDIIIGNSTLSGSMLPKGMSRAVLMAGTTTVAYEFVSELRDSLGNIVIQGINSPGAVNTLGITGGTTGIGVEISASGADVNINILLSPLGTGNVIVPATYVPGNDFSLVNKKYVDSVATGLDFKNSVQVATSSAAELTGFVYTALTDEWTNVLSATIDGVILANNARILIKNSIDAKGNGIWDYNSLLSKFVRSPDANNVPSPEVSGGMFTFVETGTLNSDTGWVMSSPNGPAILGTDNLIFTQFSSAGVVSVTGGNGVVTVQSGTVYNVTANVDNATISNTGGTGSQISVFNGIQNQLLISQGTGIDAVWGFNSSLYDINGMLIVQGVSSVTPVNYVNISSSNTTIGPSITSAGSDINVDLLINTQGTGRINLDGTLWPHNPISPGTILGANIINDLQPISATLLGIGDQLLKFNDTTKLLEWVAASTIGGNDWGNLALSGNTIGDILVAPNSTNTTLSLIGGSGIELTGNNITDSVKYDLSINTLPISTSTVGTVDTVVFHDSATGTNQQITLDNLVNSVVRDAYNEVVALGAPNEIFLGFFTNLPVNDLSITIFFNGVALRSQTTAGWARTGNNLTLVDAVNGYAAEAGDLISATYRY